MKKILLLSDTHGYVDDRILSYAKTVDEVWHAGDIGQLTVTDRLAKIKPLRAVYGNIDSNEIRSEFPEFARFENLDEVEALDLPGTTNAGLNQFNQEFSTYTIKSKMDESSEDIFSKDNADEDPF